MHHMRDVEYRIGDRIDEVAPAVAKTIDHVREYLAAAADADDDPTTLRDDVRVETLTLDENGQVVGDDSSPELGDRRVVRVIGYLAGHERDAPYLRADYDPEQDVGELPADCVPTEGLPA